MWVGQKPTDTDCRAEEHQSAVWALLNRHYFAGYRLRHRLAVWRLSLVACRPDLRLRPILVHFPGLLPDPADWCRIYFSSSPFTRTLR